MFPDKRNSSYSVEPYNVLFSMEGLMRENVQAVSVMDNRALERIGKGLGVESPSLSGLAGSWRRGWTGFQVGLD